MKRGILRNVSMLVAGAALGLAAVTCTQSTRPEDNPGSATSTVARTFLPSPAFASAVASDQAASLADVAEKAVPSVVNISATRLARAQQQHPMMNDPMLRHFFGPQMPRGPQEQTALGSGVIVSADGIVLTNNHVVDGAEEVVVTLNDGRELSARVEGKDPKSDLAVIRITDEDDEIGALQPIEFGDSAELRLGDVVLAVGNPFGVGQTVTMGIVSAKGRPGMGLVDYADFIQTDAAINPGNSGGALINMRGELIGINTAIASRSGGYDGVGFAIPTAMAQPIMDSLLANGKVVRGWLGVAIQDIDSELRDGLGLKTTNGVLVSDVVADSPAHQAGLQRGDVIVSVDGVATKDANRLRNIVASRAPESRVPVEVIRDGKTRTLTVTLGALAEASADKTSVEPSEGALGGVVLGELTDAIRQRLDLSEEIQGVAVLRVQPGSAAHRAGLRPGDVIVEIDRTPVSSVEAFEQRYANADDRALLLINRGGTTHYLAVRKR